MPLPPGDTPPPPGTPSAGAGGGPTPPSDLEDHPAVVRVRAALRRSGARGDVVTLPSGVRTAAAAAARLGVEVGQIANSLVFAVPDPQAPGGRRALLVLTSGAHRVDAARLAADLALDALERADPDLVRRSTGSAIGGVAPVGHPQRLQTVVDVALSAFDQVWAAGGHPRTVFPTSYDELLRITGGTPATVA